MTARISCSRTWKLTPESALTPPKASEMLSTLSSGSPSRRAPISGGLLRRRWREGLRPAYLQIGTDPRLPAIFEFHLGLGGAAFDPGVERRDQRRVFLRDEAAAHFAGAGELVVVRVEFLVQHQKALDLRASKMRVARQVG